MTTRTDSMLYPALLKHWRGRRGLSQLDLALCADVSARHISFLETGRSRASREMVLRLASALEVPLRDQNEMLLAAGLPAEFQTPDFETGLPEAISRAIDHMLARHEPFPMVVMNRCYDVLRFNGGAQRLFMTMCADSSRLMPPLNVGRMLFDPGLSRPFVDDWPHTARSMLSGLHREALSRPSDARLRSLVEALLEYPDVPPSWRVPDFSQPSGSTMAFTLQRGELRLRLLTTVTTFHAPQNVTLEELRIESYFPLDDATDAALHALARA